MINEINEIIKNNLPVAVATELKQYLATADQNEKILVVAREKEKKQDIEIKRLLAVESEFQKEKEVLIKKQQELSTLEASLKIKQDGLEQTLLLVKLSESEKRSDSIFQLVHAIFRNPVITKTISENIPIPVDGAPANQYNSGYGGTIMNGTKTGSTIITKE